jgi:hypothetical protein
MSTPAFNYFTNNSEVISILMDLETYPNTGYRPLTRST